MECNISEIDDSVLVRAPQWPSDPAQWIGATGPVPRVGDGIVTVLHFLSVGCADCIDSQIQVEDIRFRPFLAGVRWIAVHSPQFPYERRADLRASEQRNIGFPIILDHMHDVGEAYSVRSLPSFVVIDKGGMIAGQASGTDALSTVTKLLVRHFSSGQDHSRREQTPATCAPDANGLLFPSAVAVSALSQKLAIADTGNDRIVVIDLQGKATRIFGGRQIGLRDGPADQCAFRAPRGLSFLDNDTLLVADTGNHAIRRIDVSSGSVTTICAPNTGFRLSCTYRTGTFALSVSSPWGILSALNRAWVTLAGTHEIVELFLDDSTLRTLAGDRSKGLRDGGIAQAQFAQPVAIALSEYNLYIADAESSSIRMLSTGPNPRVNTILGTHADVCGDRDGSLAKALLQHPEGIAAVNGHLYVADTYNHKIKRIDLQNKVVSTVAGRATAGAADGAAESASFCEPCGLAAVGSAIYVADRGNHAVRKLDLVERTVSTVYPLSAGTGEQAAQLRD